MITDLFFLFRVVTLERFATDLISTAYRYLTQFISIIGLHQMYIDMILSNIYYTGC